MVDNVVARRPMDRRGLVGSILRAYPALEWQAHIVIVLAVAAMAYSQFALPLFWGSGDPLDYYRIARLFLHKSGGLLVPGRPPGMALFLILTGVAWLDTFKVLIVVYAAMSVAIPVLIYVIVRRYSPTWGMVAALTAIMGAVPYAYSRILWPEQLFHFLHFAALALIAAYFARPENPRLPYAIALAVAALNLVRPVAALYYWLFLVCAAVLVRRPLKHVLLAAAVYVGLMGGWALADRYWGASIFPTVYVPETAAQRLFGEVYFSGGQYQFVPERPPAPVLRPGDGPASAQMYEAIRELAHDPNQWQPGEERPYLLFARFTGHPGDLTQAVTTRPNFAYFDFLRQALRAKNGVQGTEALLYRAAAEHGNTGLRGVIGYFVHDPMKLMIGGTPPSNGRYLLKLFYQLQLRKDMGSVYSLTFSGSDVLNPANGPGSKEFFAVLDMFVRAYPNYWEYTNEWLSRFRGDPEGLPRAMFDSKLSGGSASGVYEGFYWESLSKYYGVGAADRLLGRVALETITAYPHTIGLFWDNLLHIVLIRSVGGIAERSTGRGDWFSMFTDRGDVVHEVRTNDFTGLTSGLVRELQKTVRYDKHVGLAYGTFHHAPPLFFIASLALFSFCLLGPARGFAVFLAVAYAYNVATIVVFGVTTTSRYEDVFILLPVVLACLGAHFAIATLRQRAVLAANARVRAA